MYCGVGGADLLDVEGQHIPHVERHHSQTRVVTKVVAQVGGHDGPQGRGAQHGAPGHSHLPGWATHQHCHLALFFS